MTLANSALEPLVVRDDMEWLLWMDTQHVLRYGVIFDTRLTRSYKALIEY